MLGNHISQNSWNDLIKHPVCFRWGHIKRQPVNPLLRIRGPSRTPSRPFHPCRAWISNGEGQNLKHIGKSVSKRGRQLQRWLCYKRLNNLASQESPISYRIRRFPWCRYVMASVRLQLGTTECRHIREATSAYQGKRKTIPFLLESGFYWYTRESLSK